MTEESDQRGRVAEAEARAALERVLGSPQLAGSARLQQFLRFVVEEELAGRGGELKESVVATRVFHRAATFDPRTDSAVRVAARALRGKLEEYERSSGDEVVFEMPRGGYVPVVRRRRRAPRWSWWWVGGVAAGVVLAVGLGWWWRGRGVEPAVAVLPLENVGAGAEGDFLADSVGDEVTAALARWPGLRVAARSSAARFKVGSQDVAEAGRRLRVGSVVQGSVKRLENEWQVTLNLVDCGDGYYRHTVTYRGRQTNLAPFVAQFAGETARRLAARGRAAGQTRAPKEEAQELYWRARFHFRKGTAGQEAGLAALRRAIEVDPEYARAHATLANVLAHSVYHGIGERGDEVEEVRREARRAIELDPAASDAYTALAMIAYAYDAKWGEAEGYFRKGLEVNPSAARGHQAYAVGLLSRGRFAEALVELGLARGLDPLSQLVANDEATILYGARRYAESVAAATRTLEAEPGFLPAFVIRGCARTMLGRHAEAEQDLNQALGKGPRGKWLLGRLAYLKGVSGRREEARALLEEMTKSAEPGRVALALAYAGLGERGRAAEELERALEERETDVVFLGVEPMLGGLKGERRYEALRRRLGL